MAPADVIQIATDLLVTVCNPFTAGRSGESECGNFHQCAANHDQRSGADADVRAANSRRGRRPDCVNVVDSADGIVVHHAHDEPSGGGRSMMELLLLPVVLCFLRVSAFVAFLPPFGGQHIPNMVKVGLAVALTGFWLPRALQTPGVFTSPGTTVSSSRPTNSIATAVSATRASHDDDSPRRWLLWTWLAARRSSAWVGSGMAAGNDSDPSPNRRILARGTNRTQHCVGHVRAPIPAVQTSSP